MEDTHRTALAHLWLAVEAELPIGSIEPEATFDYLFDRLITIALGEARRSRLHGGSHEDRHERLRKFQTGLIVTRP
jgi:hypothetical protein